MHPAFYWWYNRAHRRDGCGEGEACHPGHPAHEGGGHRHRPPFEAGYRFGHEGDGFFGGGGGPFGVRRPLRFLAHKLELSEAQIAELARILDELKTERAQADVDQRRTIAAFADAIEAASFGDTRAKEGGEQRVKTAERLRDAVVKALSQIHATLDEEQRKRFAYLIRTGVVAL
jgi:Spy/CpxP family protein refolding chaperone